MMDWSPQCYISSFLEIGRGSGEEDFLKVFTIKGRGGHLGHVTSIISSDFYFLVPESFHTNLIQISTVVSDEVQFEFLYVHDLWPRSRNDFDLQYLHIFIYSIRCLLLLIFSSLAAKVSEKSSFFHFFLKKTLSYQI